MGPNDDSLRANDEGELVGENIRNGGGDKGEINIGVGEVTEISIGVGAVGIAESWG